MKKVVLVITLVLLTVEVLAQSILSLNQNNVSAMISDQGHFFNSLGTSVAGYEVPKGGGNHTMYIMNFWMGGLDDANQLHFAKQNYTDDGLAAGPIANDYNTTSYTSKYTSSIWRVTRDQINFHVNNFTAVGYVPDPAIVNWPGNGDVLNGISAQLATYVDVNNDQIYNPLAGDYPYIQGDDAVYVIMNDLAANDTLLNVPPVGVEIHVMFYQFNSTDAVNNTTFMNVKLFNRGGINYHDFRFGLFLDYDLGAAVDDYVGCDSTRNLSYVYNGTSTDYGQGGQPGYGADVPAFGTLFLNESMGSFVSFGSGGGGTGDPYLALAYYNYLGATRQNGAHVLYGGNGYDSGITGGLSNFMYSGNPHLNSGWNELTEGHSPGDRRGIMAIEPFNFPASDSKCVDIAFIYNRDGGTIENANNLLATADFIQNYYDNAIQPCNQIFLENETQVGTNFTLYPNPSEGVFFIDMPENGTISIYNLNGQIVASEICNIGQNRIDLNLNSGIYIVQLKTETSIKYAKIEVIK